MATLWRGVLVFVPLALLVAGVLYVRFSGQEATAQSVLRAGQSEIASIGRQWVANELASVVSDVRYLTRQTALRRWLADPDPAALREVADNFLVLATVKGVYDQIRFIVFDGRELVRVNWNAGSPAVVPEDALQTKVERYYTREALSVGAGQIYVSHFDLNVEHGAVERPIKPTVRFGAPVFDTSGRRRGVVVVNYLGQHLLDGVERIGSGGPGELWMLNADGDWLLGPSTAASRSFADAGRREPSFAQSHPRAWQRIRDGPAAGQFLAGGDLLTYTKVTPAVRQLASQRRPDAEPYAVLPRSWILVARVPGALLAEQRGERGRAFAAAFVPLALLVGGVAAVIARYSARRSRAELRRRTSEARFRALLESAPDAVVIIDPNGHIVLVNARTEQLFGHPRGRLIGQPVEILVPEPLRARHVGHRAAYANAARPRPMGTGLDLCGLRADGTEIPVAISLSPVQTDEGALIIADIRDVTEQRATERKVQELNERLRSDNAELALVNEELEAFAYSVSHDLRAPLRAIDGFSQALLEDCDELLDEAGRGYLRRVREAAQRMGQVIDDLLRLSRVTRTDVVVEEVDLGKLAQQIVDALRARDPERRVDVQIRVGSVARGDSRLLRIALENLLDNAWKFSAGRTPARIELGHCANGAGAAYYVRDNGVGFDPAYSEQLFQPFQRLHPARAFPGTGIGLATVQRIVQKHGGRVWATSQPGQGSTFFFTL